MTIEAIIRQINRELVPQFEEHLHAYQTTQEREWLIEQIIRLAAFIERYRPYDRHRLIRKEP